MPNRRDPSAEGGSAAHVSGSMGDVPSVRPDPSRGSTSVKLVAKLLAYRFLAGN